MKVTIIAEAGVNHNGSMKLAKQLIEIAADSGADYVKFQTFKAENLATKTAKKATYQKNLTDSAESQFEMLKKLELTYDQHKELIDWCTKLDISFLSTAFDIESADLLRDLGIQLFKIPSGEITNLPYLRHIGSLGHPVILSTGMSTISEINAAIDVLNQSGLDRKKITVLHCNTQYPTPFEDANINAMLTIRDESKVKIGYSDHTTGIEAPIAAVALGAKIIEKHFTLSRDLEGPDHQASLEPYELKQMIGCIRNIEKAMGDGKKFPTDSEKNNIDIARKSIVAKTKINKGEIFTDKNLTTKRPGNGISPMRWDDIIGKVSKKNFNEDDLID